MLITDEQKAEAMRGCAAILDDLSKRQSVESIRKDMLYGASVLNLAADHIEGQRDIPGVIQQPHLKCERCGQQSDDVEHYSEPNLTLCVECVNHLLDVLDKSRVPAQVATLPLYNQYEEPRCMSCDEGEGVELYKNLGGYYCAACANLGEHMRTKRPGYGEE